MAYYVTFQANLEHYQAATQQLREEQALLLDKQRQEYERRQYESQQQLADKGQRVAQLQAQLNHTEQQVAQLEGAHAKQAQSIDALRQQSQSCKLNTIG